MLGLGAAAVAVGGAVEPAQAVDTTVRAAYEQGRADGYNRGRAVEEARQEARRESLNAPTIEALQEACAARGCALETHYSVQQLMHVFRHMPTRTAEWAEGIMLIEKADSRAVSQWLGTMHTA
jgi:hypothetical protein